MSPIVLLLHKYIPWQGLKTGNRTVSNFVYRSPPSAVERGKSWGASLIPLDNAASAAGLSAQSSGEAALNNPAHQMKLDGAIETHSTSSG